MPDFSRTIEALKAFDAVPYQYGENEQLARAVGRAYGLDTSDINNPADCEDLIRPGPPYPATGEADVSFVRRMVRDHHTPPQKEHNICIVDPKRDGATMWDCPCADCRRLRRGA